MTLMAFHRFFVCEELSPFPHLKCAQWADDKRKNNIVMTCTATMGTFLRKFGV